MATITLHYDARNSIAAKAIDYVMSLGVFETENRQYTDTFKRSVEEMQYGKTYRLENTENPIAEILR